MASSETSLQTDLVSLVTDSVEPCPRLFEHLVSLQCRWVCAVRGEESSRL